MHFYVVFSPFTSRPASLLASNKMSIVSLWSSCICLVNKHLQHRPEAIVFHSLRVPFCFLGFSWWPVLNWSWKAVVIEFLLVSDPSEEEMHQKDDYLYSLHCGVSFKHTLIGQSSFIYIPNWVRLLYNTPFSWNHRLFKSINVQWVVPFFSSIWWMQKICLLVDQLCGNPHWSCLVVTSAYGVNIDREHKIKFCV
jgi:hypothetical protein